MRIKRHVGRIPPTVLEDGRPATFAQSRRVDTVKISRSGNGVGTAFATVAIVPAVLLRCSMK